MTVEILLRVTRDADDRLDGSASVSGESEVHAFSGMLELMHVFEQLVPANVGTTDGRAGGARQSEP